MAPSRWRGRTSDQREFRSPHRPAYHSSLQRSLQVGRRASATSESIRDNDPRQSHTLHQPESSSTAINLSNLDRNFWERRTRFPTEGNLTIARVLTCLGLKQKSGKKRSIVSFQNKGVGELADAIALVANKLPIEAPKFVILATQPGMMMAIAENLLERFGMRVWGAELHREWLLEPGEVEGYARELRYEDEDDHPALREYLRLWILVRGANAVMYTKHKRPGTSSASPGISSAEWNPHLLPTYDCAFWEYELKALKPTLDILSIVDSLGLERCLTRHGPIALHTSGDGEELELAIVAVADTLPKDKANLLEIAAEPEKLHGKVDALLLQFGDKLWDEQRKKCLVYSNLHDRIALRYYIRLWIIVQASSSSKSSAPSRWKSESRSQCQYVGRYLDEEEEESWSGYEEENERQLQPNATKASLKLSPRQQKNYKSPAPINESVQPFSEHTRSSMVGPEQFEPNRNGQDDAEFSLQKEPPLSVDNEGEPEYKGQLESAPDQRSLVHVNNINTKPKLRGVSEIQAERVKKPAPQHLFAKQSSPTHLNDDTDVSPEQISGSTPALYHPAASTAKEQEGIMVPACAADGKDTSAVLSNVPSEPTAAEESVVTPLVDPEEPAPSTEAEEPLSSIVMKAKVWGKKRGSLPQAEGDSKTPIGSPAEDMIQSSQATRVTRGKVVRTYNEAILSGHARHTRTEYLEKHLSKVLHDTTDAAQPQKRTASDGSLAGQATKRQKSTASPSNALTNAFLDYFKSDNNTPVQETSLLDEIERKLTAFASNPSSDSSFLVIITAWLKLRRTITSVQQRVPRVTDPPVSQGHVKMNRSRLLTELRVARDAFLAVQGDKVFANETVMAEDLGKIQGTPAARKEVKATILQGLKKCNEQLFALGEELGSGKWVLMG